MAIKSPQIANAKVHPFIDYFPMVDISAREPNSKILNIKVPTLTGKMILFLLMRVAVGCDEALPMMAIVAKNTIKTTNKIAN